ncbi:MAG: hypothetical protein MUO23_00260 [Anaerolineales bacterium]|nr:hypothetical protein [Anaerolineales bacterium]
MRRSGMFWGIGLILLGSLLILDRLGVLPFELTGLFLPILLILAGVWVIWGISGRDRRRGDTSLRVPVEQAALLKLRLQHGAGRLRLDASASEPDALDASFGTGARHEVLLKDRVLSISLCPRDAWFFLSAPWGWWRGEPPDWVVHLPRTIPTELDVETGASETLLELVGVRLSSLRFRTGASSSEIHLARPQGSVPVTVAGGATAIRLRLPAGVEARVRSRTDLASVNLDRVRFVRDGAAHVTSGFEQAADRYEIEIRVGAGSVDIR